MAHVVDDLLEEARQAMRAMQAAALRARALHARAELMRHMRGTAAKTVGAAGGSDAAAIARTTDEWMQAWGLGRDAYPELAGPFRAFTEAFTRDARSGAQPGGDGSAAIAAAMQGLESALATIGTSIADQMAFRSECAHGWWAMVVPVPEDLPGRRVRKSVPQWSEQQAFWEVGAAARCG